MIPAPAVAPAAACLDKRILYVGSSNRVVKLNEFVWYQNPGVDETLLQKTVTAGHLIKFDQGEIKMQKLIIVKW